MISWLLLFCTFNMHLQINHGGITLQLGESALWATSDQLLAALCPYLWFPRALDPQWVMGIKWCLGINVRICFPKHCLPRIRMNECQTHSTTDVSLISEFIRKRNDQTGHHIFRMVLFNICIYITREREKKGKRRKRQKVRIFTLKNKLNVDTAARRNIVPVSVPGFVVSTMRTSRSPW